MELIGVEFIEQSSGAIFFNVAFNVKGFFGYESKVKRAYLEKWSKTIGGYANNFQWSDGTKNEYQFNSAVLNEMILQYEKNTKS